MLRAGAKLEAQDPRSQMACIATVIGGYGTGVPFLPTGFLTHVLVSGRSGFLFACLGKMHYIAKRHENIDIFYFVVKTERDCLSHEIDFKNFDKNLQNLA
jgi:hypothetical protein